MHRQAYDQWLKMVDGESVPTDADKAKTKEMKAKVKEELLTSTERINNFIMQERLSLMISAAGKLEGLDV